MGVLWFWNGVGVSRRESDWFRVPEPGPRPCSYLEKHFGIGQRPVARHASTNSYCRERRRQIRASDMMAMVAHSTSIKIAPGFGRK